MAVERREKPPYPYAVKPQPRLIMGHPAGLLNLFLTQMWERFSFYGMGASLVLLLMAPAREAGLGLEPAAAVAVFWAYTGVTYLLAIPGGWVADRLTGTRRAVLAGGVAMAIGLYVLAIPAGVTVHLGLIVVALGAGLFQPNVATMVGELYDQLPDGHHAKRDAGFSVFYMGVNLGAFGGVLANAWLAQRYGWHLGFAVGAIAMTIGVVQYVAARGILGDVGLDAHRPVDEYRRGPTLRRAGTLAVIWLVALVVAAVLRSEATGRSMLDSALVLVASVVVAVPIVVLTTILREHTLTPVERSRIRAYLPFLLGAAVFWLIGYQIDGLLGTTIGQQWVYSLLIVILAPLFAVVWTRLGDRAPNTPVRFAVGVLGMGGAVVIVGLASVSARPGQLSAPPMFGLYVVPALASLFLVPIGLSLTTRLAPPRFASQMMGLWFAATGMGQAVGGYMQRLNGTVPGAVYYGLLGVLAVAVGMAFLVMAPRIRRLMAGVE